MCSGHLLATDKATFDPLSGIIGGSPAHVIVLKQKHMIFSWNKSPLYLFHDLLFRLATPGGIFQGALQRAPFEKLSKNWGSGSKKGHIKTNYDNKCLDIPPSLGSDTMVPSG